jgi:hypothetical protein
LTFLALSRLEKAESEWRLVISVSAAAVEPGLAGGGVDSPFRTLAIEI